MPQPGAPKLRMSPVDMAMFLLETDARPMNVGALAVLGPPPGFRGDLAGHLIRRMLRRPVGPPFNHRLRDGGRGMLPALEVDPGIDPAALLRRRRVPAPGDRAALFAAVCEIHAARFSRSGPLWEAWVLDGLPRGRVALYFKTHHGLIDGIGFMNVFLRCMDRSPRSRRARAVWEGLGPEVAGAAPAAASNPLPTLAGLANGVLGQGRAALGLAGLTARMLLRGAGADSGLAPPFVATPQVLKAGASPHRVLGHCVLPLPRVREVAARTDSKVNDVLLCLLDAAMHRYLADRGEAPDRPLVADMPVALSREAGTGNRLAILPLPLGRPGASHAARLEDVKRETRRVKGEVRTASGLALELYTTLVHAAAGAIESLGLGELPMLANTVISNPYGLTERVWFNGLPVELGLPVSVVPHHQSLNITATTYIDELNVTFMALREALPDVQRLADHTVDALAALDRETGRRPPRRAAAARRS